jgi:hypothetical protein
MPNPLSTALVFLGIGVARRRGPTEAAVVVGGFAVLYFPWLAVTAERFFTFLFYLCRPFRSCAWLWHLGDGTFEARRTGTPVVPGLAPAARILAPNDWAGSRPR